MGMSVRSSEGQSKEEAGEQTESTSQFSEIIKDAMDYCELEDALFLAELCHAKVNCEESLLSVADALCRLNRWTELYNLLTGRAKGHCRLRYLFARACFELDKYDECQATLIDARSRGGLALHPSLINTKAEPFAYLLLSKVIRRLEHNSDTLFLLSESVRENPFMWSAIVDYTKFGGQQVTKLMSHNEQQFRKISIGGSQETVANENNRRQPARTPMASTNQTMSPPSSGGSKRATPSMQILPPPHQPPAPRKSTRFIDQNSSSPLKKRHISTRSSKQLATPPNALIGQKEATENTTSVRQLRKAKPLSTHNANPQLTAGRRLSDSNYSLASDTTIEEEDVRLKAGDNSSLYGEMSMYMRRLAEIEEALWQHEHSTAKSLIADVPGLLRSTIVCHLQLARAEFELGNFHDARSVLERMHACYPHTTAGMELLSTVLWYLEERRSLSALALKMHNDVASYKLPETWVVIANSFSLQGDHQQAIAAIQRAQRLSPRLSHLYTMAGHEHIVNDDLTSAEEAYKKAVLLHPRDYRAYFGLGQVYLKKEDHNLAKASLSRAYAINPYNKTVLCCLAEIDGYLRNFTRAFELLQVVLKMDPGYMAALFQRAKMHYQLSHFEECLRDLLELQELSPSEASVQHLLGRVYRRLGQPHLSVKHYNCANSMDPNSSTLFPSDLVGAGSESGSEGDIDDELDSEDGGGGVDMSSPGEHPIELDQMSSF